MKVKVDFQLNRRFGIVETIIFRLVLNGFSDIRDITSALTLFSDSVIANAVANLVNHQILYVNGQNGRLALTESLLAIIEMCIEKECEIEIPPSFSENMEGRGILITGKAQEETRVLKEAILYELLPGIKLDMYVDLIDFIIYESGRGGASE